MVLFLLYCLLLEATIDLLAQFDYSLDDKIRLANEYKRYISSSLETSTRNNLIDSKLNIDHSKTINTEDRRIMSIDLGGTAFKISVWEHRGGEIKQLSGIERIPILKDEVSGKDLFDWMAEHIKKYLVEHSLLSNVDIDTSFTFSYPIKKHNAVDSTLIMVTKDFPFNPIDFSRDNDPSKLLIDSCKRIGVAINVRIVLNDADATFLSHYSNSDDFVMGIVLGTGANASFKSTSSDGAKLLNSEWGMYNSSALKATKFDKMIESEIVRSGRPYCAVDVMVGGKRNIQLINSIYREMSNNSTVDSHEDLKQLSFTNFTNPFPWKYEDLTDIEKIVYRVNRRNQGIIASLVLGTLQFETEQNGLEYSKLVLVLNGSVYEEQWIRDLLRLELNSMAKNLIGEIEVIFDNEASLIGGVKGALMN